MDDSRMFQVLTEGRALHRPQIVMVLNSRCTQFLWHSSFTVKLISCSGCVRCLLYRFPVSATYGVSKACIIRDVRTGGARCVCCTFARMNLIGALELLLYMWAQIGAASERIIADQIPLSVELPFTRIREPHAGISSDVSHTYAYNCEASTLCSVEVL